MRQAISRAKTLFYVNRHFDRIAYMMETYRMLIKL